MKTIKLIFLILILNCTLYGQTYHIYIGTTTNYDHMIYTLTDDAVYLGTTTNYSSQIFTLTDVKVYEGHTTNYSELKYQLYGPYVMDKSGNVYIYTTNNEKIYKGKGTSYQNCVFTYDGIHVYNGNSTSYSSILYTVSGPIDIHTIAWLLGSETIVTTGMIEKKSNYRIYPNPNNGKFKLVSNDSEKTNYKILNSLGITVYEDEIYSKEIDINLRLSNGLYFLSIANKREKFYVLN